MYRSGEESSQDFCGWVQLPPSPPIYRGHGEIESRYNGIVLFRVQVPVAPPIYIGQWEVIDCGVSKMQKS